MASGFFALLDDIAVLMDDVATMSKLATKKTAGILADDLAVNAEKASGFVSKRELPVLWKIAKGSFLNKLIILPVVFLLNAFLPVLITPILLIGGTYLAFEGAEKIYEFLVKKKENKKAEKLVQMTPEEAVAFENKRVKSAILVDFILSVEIIIIALGVVREEGMDMTMQITVVSVVAIIATIGVYGLVGLLVRMDDAGLHLVNSSQSETSFKARLGQGMIDVLPWIVRGLGVLGTLAMILVGGGIFVHNIHYIHDLFHSWPSILAEFFVGLVVGAIALLLYNLVTKIYLGNFT
jgi:predicted DNA repair protein MutK